MLHTRKAQAITQCLLGDSANVYLYVHNSPINETDPTGLFAEDEPSKKTPMAPRFSPAGKWEDGGQLKLGVKVTTADLEVKVRTSVEKKLIGYDANSKEIMGDAFVIHVSAKDVDPKDIEIVQFLHRDERIQR
jgi:hypothetical protein